MLCSDSYGVSVKCCCFCHALTVPFFLYRAGQNLFTLTKNICKHWSFAELCIRRESPRDDTKIRGKKQECPKIMSDVIAMRFDVKHGHKMET